MHRTWLIEKLNKNDRKHALRRQRLEQWGVEHPFRAAVPFLCTAGVVLLLTVTAASCTLCYRVEVQGQSVACFQDTATYEAALTQAENRASAILSTDYTLDTDTIDVRTTLAPKDRVEELSGVTGSLMESIPELEHVYTLYVDGTFVGAASDGDTITQALNLVKEAYTTAETRSLHIDSQVDIRYQYLPSDTGEQTAEELAQTLLSEMLRTFSYIVQAGDTMESVAENFAMTEERFRELNPDLTLEQTLAASAPQDEYPDDTDEAAQSESQTTETASVGTSNIAEAAAVQSTETQTAREVYQSGQTLSGLDLSAVPEEQLCTPLEEGTEITVEQSCPLLVVSTVEEVTLTQEITPTLETQEDTTMYQGQQRILQEGEAGSASVLSRVVKRCGVVVANNNLNTITLTEATPLIVATGTQEMSNVSGDLFLWPVRGPITSDFGYRFIFGENNFHRGVDIAAAEGTAINAAADGTVIFAGEKGTYGNLVMISHANGMITCYGHCSKILVTVGETVSRGDVIAAVGSTGRSTGPHCHFEVRYGSELLDPLCYLPGENNAPVRTVPLDTEAPQKENAEEETPAVDDTTEPTIPLDTPAVDPGDITTGENQSGEVIEEGTEANAPAASDTDSGGQTVGDTPSDTEGTGETADSGE